MRYLNSWDRCILCGAEVDIPEGKTPVRVSERGSGKPDVRVVLVDGAEVHRCVGRADSEPR